MALPADQLDLLQVVADAIAGWQATALGLTPDPVSIQQMTVEMPPTGQSNLVQFTWDADAGVYNIAMLNGK